MAERLEESIDVISADRDRSREFVADVTHELRTPIAALRTFNELLLEGAAEDPATRDEFLEQSARQIERLDWLATNLLELSKLDSGLVAPGPAPDDLRAVVESAVQQAEPVAGAEGGRAACMHLPRRAGPPAPRPAARRARCWPTSSATPSSSRPRGGRVDVELERRPRRGLGSSVTDTGVGIPPDELPHVFERFWRGARDPRARGSGSGLGLSIVRSIVDMHEGTRQHPVRRSASGTRVSVELPRNDVGFFTDTCPG